MEYSFQKTYTLLPQSPLIHFQHDQQGATLRATEVKPKLDRYIIRRWQREHNGTNIPEEWIIPNTPEGKIALKYQLRIIAEGEIKTVELGIIRERQPDGRFRNIRTPYEIYYGNMGDNEDKMGVLCTNTLTVTCYIPSLLEFIDTILFDFFIVNNFGTMQSKGFGSYRVKGFPKSIVDLCNILKEEYACRHVYYFKTTGDKAFGQIKMIYSLIKSGVNMSFRNPNEYRRSMLFTYMHDLGIGNEKAWMKQQKISPAIGDHPYNPNGKDPVVRYVRALLGLGELIEYKNSLTDSRDKVIVNIADSYKKIERFSSPILFKVIGRPEAQYVLFIGKEVNSDIYGKSFTFSSKMGSGTLQVPKKDELPEDFMDGFMEYVYDELYDCQLDFPSIKTLDIKEV